MNRRGGWTVLLAADALSVAIAHADDPVVLSGSPACVTLFEREDPRLFDFVGTRKSVDYAQYSGKRIAGIDYMTLPIFNENDPEEDTGIYRAANRLHINTRREPIEKQMLVKRGDSLAPNRIAEAERILRGASYLYDAMILPARVCGDSIDLLVVVRDIWTMQPTASFKHAGGQSSSSLGFSDDNLFGNGHGMNVSWNHDAARSGIELAYDNRHLFDGHSLLEMGHAKNSDGYDNNFLLARPFYALDTRWSTGVDFSQSLLSEAPTSSGVIANRFDHREFSGEAFFGFSDGLRDNKARRWRLGFTHTADVFENQDPVFAGVPMPADRVLTYPWVEYEVVEDSFKTLSNVSQLFRNEDINTGEGWRVRGGSTNNWFGGKVDALVGELAYSNTLGFGKHHLLRNVLTADAFLNESTTKLENSKIEYQANYDYFIDDNNRWHAMFEAGAGAGLPVDRQFTAGGETHLYGYPAAWQRGDRRVIASVERRHFYQVHPFHLFRLGAAAFLEAGKAWDPVDTVIQSDSRLVDVGIGLRVNSSKARPNKVMHFNVAVPLTDRAGVSGYQWSIFVGEAF